MPSPVSFISATQPPAVQSSSNPSSGGFDQVLNNEMAQQNSAVAPTGAMNSSSIETASATPSANQTTSASQPNNPAPDVGQVSTQATGATQPPNAATHAGQTNNQTTQTNQPTNAGQSNNQTTNLKQSASQTVDAAVVASSSPSGKTSPSPQDPSALNNTTQANTDGKKSISQQNDSTPNTDAAAQMLAMMGYGQPVASTANPSVGTTDNARSTPLINNKPSVLTDQKPGLPTNTTLPATPISTNTTGNLSALPASAANAASFIGALNQAGNTLASATSPDPSTNNALISSQMAANLTNPLVQPLTAFPGDAIGHLAPHVGSSAWDDALTQRVVWMANGAEQSATLSLNPPDLGPLRIVLNVSNNQANATFIAQQPEVRQAIEAALPKLESMMMGAGIQLGQANVRSDNQSQSGQSFQFQQNASGQARRTISAVSTGVSAPANLQKLTAGQGLVNTFV